jgi:hypothetical protein
MTVAASIILAAIFGGIVFVLLDSWQRRAASPVVPSVDPQPAFRPEPPRPTWDIDTRKPEGPQDSLWSGWAGRRN